MTVIAAYLDRKRHQLAIGADSQLTMGAFKSRAEPKVVHLGSALLSFSGVHLFRRFWHHVEAPSGETLGWCWEQQARFQAWLGERGHGEVQGGLKGVDFWGVVAAPDGLFELSGTGDVTTTQEPYALAGVGAAVAAGVLHALSRHAPHLSAEELVHAACLAACAHAEGCSEPLHVLSLRW